jgi:hypothetical protein
MSPRVTDVVLAVVLGLFLVGLYNANGTVLLGNDTRPARYAAVSLVKRGDLDLDEFRRDLGANGDDLPYFVLRDVRGKLLSRFGFGAPAAAAPVFAVALAVNDGRLSPHAALHLAKLASSLYVALAGAILFLLARRLDASRAIAAAVALTYGALGLALSVVSQALWQHGPAEAFLALGLYLLVRAGPLSLPAAGAAFSAMVVCRPPDAIFAVMAAGYVVVAHRRTPWRIAGFLLGAAPLAIVQLVYNAIHFGAFWQFSQTITVVGRDAAPVARYWGDGYAEGLAGLLLSPSRGLFVYSPIYLFLLWRPVASFRAHHPAIRWALAGAVLLVVVQAAYYGWYGGWTFGYRMLADATPVLALALLPALQRLPRASRVLQATFALAAAASLSFHLAGAWCYQPADWDGHPNIDQNLHRLWSVEDSQLVHTLRNLRPRM